MDCCHRNCDSLMQASAGVAALRHTVAKIIQDLNLQIQNIKLLYYKNVVSFFWGGLRHSDALTFAKKIRGAVLRLTLTTELLGKESPMWSDGEF